MTFPSELREHKITCSITSPTTGEVSPRKFFGIVDLYKDGQIIDFKTCGDPDQYAQDQALSPQLPLYALALEANGITVRSARYKLLQRPTLKWKKNQTAESYIAEIQERCLSDRGHVDHEIPMVPPVLRYAQTLLWEVVKRIDRTATPLPNRSACRKWGRPCEFWDICTGNAMGADVDSIARQLYEPRRDNGAPEYVSFSQVETFLQCERMFELRYRENLRAKRDEDSEALAVGRGFHGLMELGDRQAVLDDVLDGEVTQDRLKAAGMALAALQLWGGSP